LVPAGQGLQVAPNDGRQSLRRNAALDNFSGGWRTGKIPLLAVQC